MGCPVRKSLLKFLFPSRTEPEPESPPPVFDHGMRFVDKEYSARVIEQVNGKTGSGLVRRKQHTYENGGDRLQERPLDDWLKDVPRYPPYPNAIPAAPAETIIISQASLLHDLAVGFGQDDQLFQGIIMPVVRNFVDWVHLLPASKSHHHCGLGGAYRHALETATNAAKLIRNEVPNPSIRKRDEAQYDKRLRAAAIISGLLHDSGKPISDVALIDPSGNKEWNPNSRSIMAWTEREGISSYYMQWRDKRYGNHELFSGRMLDRIVPDAVMEWLDEFGPGLQVWMAEAVTGTGDRQANPIHKVVRIADEASAAKDISSDHRLNGGSLGIPMEQNILDAMRRILHSDMWVVNEKGSPLWVDQDHQVYLIWSRAAADIVHRLHEDKIKGILRDPDSIGEALYETGILVPNPYAEQCQIHPMYWLIQPAELAGSRPDRPTVNVAVKLADASLLFASQANPRVTRIKIFEHDPRVKAKKAESKTPRSAVDTAHPEPSADVPQRRDVVVSDAEPVEMPNDRSHQTKPTTKTPVAPPQDQSTPEADELQQFWSRVNVIHKDMQEHCEPFQGHGSLAGLPAVTFPLPGLTEETSISIMERLAEEGLLASDPANPLRQLHASNNAEWVVLDAPRPVTDEGAAPAASGSSSAQGGNEPPGETTVETGVNGAIKGASQPAAGDETPDKATPHTDAKPKKSNAVATKNEKPNKRSALKETEIRKKKPRTAPINEKQLDIFEAEGVERSTRDTYRLIVPPPLEFPPELKELSKSLKLDGEFIPLESDGLRGKLTVTTQVFLTSIFRDPERQAEAHKSILKHAREYSEFIKVRGGRLHLTVTKESKNA